MKRYTPLLLIIGGKDPLKFKVTRKDLKYKCYKHFIKNLNVLLKTWLMAKIVIFCENLFAPWEESKNLWHFYILTDSGKSVQVNNKRMKNIIASVPDECIKVLQFGFNPWIHPQCVVLCKVNIAEPMIFSLILFQTSPFCPSRDKKKKIRKRENCSFWKELDEIGKKMFSV